MVGRQDQTTDPRLQAQLLQARRGTAFFARKLNQLSDEELSVDSLLDGWTRRHVVAHVGYNARAIARLVQWAATGIETPMYSSPEERAREIDYGATLSPVALRNLFGHAAVHLTVEWRDLPDGAWDTIVRTGQGRLVPASETVWMRTREVWVHAIDLDNGASFRDVPAEILERLLEDITRTWALRGDGADLVLSISDPVRLKEVGGAGPGSRVVRGTLAALTRWATGRGVVGVTSSGGDIPIAPRWL
ncbi:MAG: maleylpyruvate isomerase [Rhodoglobus sp.]|nr:maleylpyruvate isomerase [Rhodoglobus sp.]